MADPAPGKVEAGALDWIVAAHIQSSAVETAKIKDDAVTAAKADIFKSAEITSTAAAKAEAHGLGASPDVFFPILTEVGASTNPNLSATADATNVYVTAASTDVKYMIFAWL